MGLEEKPATPKSNHAVTGLYFFDGRAPAFSAGLTPSSRGETEIIDLLRCYLDAGALHLQPLGRGFAWLDTGTHESMLQASQFVQTIEQRQGLRIGCPEEVAWLNGWIDDAQLVRAGATAGKERLRPVPARLALGPVAGSKALTERANHQQ